MFMKKFKENLQRISVENLFINNSLNQKSKKNFHTKCKFAITIDNGKWISIDYLECLCENKECDKKKYTKQILEH